MVAVALIAYDGSGGSAHAIAVAGRLLGGGPAVVCHAWVGLPQQLLQSEPGFRGPLKEAAHELDEKSAAHAAELTAAGVDLARAAGFDAQSLAVKERGGTWRTLRTEAERQNARVIVVGASGAGWVERMVLGSVSNSLLRHARQPLLVVPLSHSAAASGRPVLLCYDSTPEAVYAIDAAGELLAERDAMVVHVWEPWSAEVKGFAGVTRAVRGAVAELDQIAEAQSATIVDEGRGRAAQAGFTPQVRSLRADGPRWGSVLRAAKAVDASVIALGSRRGGRSALVGGVSHYVAHHSDRPLLIVPAPGDETNRSLEGSP